MQQESAPIDGYPPYKDFRGVIHLNNYYAAIYILL
jgi:hypothetical protein